MQNDKTKECANPCKRCQETGECAKVSTIKKRLTAAEVLDAFKTLQAKRRNLGLLQHGGFINVNPQKAYELEQEILQLQNLLNNEHQTE